MDHFNSHLASNFEPYPLLPFLNATNWSRTSFKYACQVLSLCSYDDIQQMPVLLKPKGNFPWTCRAGHFHWSADGSCVCCTGGSAQGQWGQADDIDSSRTGAKRSVEHCSCGLLIREIHSTATSHKIPLQGCTETLLS